WHPDTAFLSYFRVIKSIVLTTHRQCGPGGSWARFAAGAVGLLAACASASADAGNPRYPATERPDGSLGRALRTSLEQLPKGPIRWLEAGCRGAPTWSVMNRTSRAAEKGLCFAK